MDAAVGEVNSLILLIAHFIWALGATIVFLAILTTGNMLLRLYREKVAAKLRDRFGDHIVGELIREEDADPLTYEPFPGTWGPPMPHFEQKILQLSLLEHLRSVTGNERKKLEELYSRCGFENKDIEQCKSPFWWVRLEAVAHLSYVRSETTAQMLFKLKNDKSDLIAGAALLALSRIDHPLNDPLTWGRFRFSILRRRSVLFEILSNTGNTRGTDFLIKWYRRTSNIEFREICLQVILTLKSTDCVSLLVEVLQNHDAVSPALLCEVLSTLKTIADPEALIPAMTYVNHPSARVRARAAELLLSNMDEHEETLLVQLENDVSAEVRRLALSYRKANAVLTGWDDKRKAAG